MSGGFTVNGTSGSNINWETDGGGDIGDSDATNRPGSIFVKTELNVGAVASTASENYIKLRVFSSVSGATGPAISLWDGVTNAWALALANNTFMFIRGGDKICQMKTGEFTLYDANTPQWYFDNTQFYIYNKGTAKSIIFQVNSDSNSTAFVTNSLKRNVAP